MKKNDKIKEKEKKGIDLKSVSSNQSSQEGKKDDGFLTAEEGSIQNNEEIIFQSFDNGNNQDTQEINDSVNRAIENEEKLDSFIDLAPQLNLQKSASDQSFNLKEQPSVVQSDYFLPLQPPLGLIEEEKEEQKCLVDEIDEQNSILLLNNHIPQQSVQNQEMSENISIQENIEIKENIIVSKKIESKRNFKIDVKIKKQIDEPIEQNLESPMRRKQQTLSQIKIDNSSFQIKSLDQSNEMNISQSQPQDLLNTVMSQDIPQNNQIVENEKNIHLQNHLEQIEANIQKIKNEFDLISKKTDIELQEEYGGINELKQIKQKYLDAIEVKVEDENQFTSQEFAEYLNQNGSKFKHEVELLMHIFDDWIEEKIHSFQQKIEPLKQNQNELKIENLKNIEPQSIEEDIQIQELKSPQKLQMKKSVSFAKTVTKIPHVNDQYPDSHRSETPRKENIELEKKEEVNNEEKKDEEQEEENNGYIFYSVLTIILIASVAAGFKIYKNISKK